MLLSYYFFGKLTGMIFYTLLNLMKPFEIELSIQSLNDRGYGISVFEENKYFVLNAIPGEKVLASIVKRKHKDFFGIATRIIRASKNRLPSTEHHFTSSAPWQIMDLAEESAQKFTYIKNVFKDVAQTSTGEFEVYSDGIREGYRNKIEYSFYYDNDGLHYSFFLRDTKTGKTPITNSSLAHPTINTVAAKLISYLRERYVIARQLKSVIFRYSYLTKSVCLQLYIKDEKFYYDQSEVELFFKEELDSKLISGIIFDYSFEKSPASITTKNFFTIGTNLLQEKIGEYSFTYPSYGFFQVNPPVLEYMIQDITDQITLTIPDHASLNLLDLYCGVGTLGISFSKLFKTLTGVELFNDAKKFCELNANNNSIENSTFIEASSEGSLEHFDGKEVIIVDPPRAGLHASVITKLKECEGCKFLLYISCNPSTMARDYQELKHQYDIVWQKAYNFYPQTPHVEHVILLKRI
jgi:23S rRNA (uracil1939-C5)-methyltransferase